MLPHSHNTTVYTEQFHHAFTESGHSGLAVFYSFDFFDLFDSVLDQCTVLPHRHNNTVNTEQLHHAFIESGLPGLAVFYFFDFCEFFDLFDIVFCYHGNIK